MRSRQHEAGTVRPTRWALRALAAVTLASVMTGCASFSQDGGFASVERTTREHLGKDVLWARSDSEREVVDERVTALLAKPLSMEEAMPQVYAELARVFDILETHYRDMQDIEFRT